MIESESSPEGQGCGLLVIDIGDVLVTTRPGGHYRALAKLANLPPKEVARRLESANLEAAFNVGLLTVREFCQSVNRLLTSELDVSAIENAWGAVIGTANPEMVQAVLPLSRQKRLLMASNTDAIHWPLVRQRLAAAGINAPTALSFQLGIAKPAVGFFEAMMSQYVNFAGPVGYIDDQVANVEAALKVGLRAIIHTTATCSVEWIRNSFHASSIA